MSAEKKTVARLFLTVFLFAAAWLCAGSALAGKQYTFIIPIAEGFSYGAMQNLLKDIGKAVTAKTGVQVLTKERVFKHGAEMSMIVLEDFKSGKGDFAYVNSQDFARMPELKKAVYPIFTFTINSKTTSQVCAYTRASDGITSPQQLKGKKWGMSSLMPTFWWMFKNGIKDEPKKFFTDMRYMDDSPITAIMDNLLANKIDAIIVSSPTIDMARSADGKYGKAVKPVGCAEYDHNLIFVANKDVPKGDADKVAAAVLGAHKDKTFQGFWFLFKAIKGHFVKFEDKNMSGTKELVAQAKKAGWYEKEAAFLKTKKGN